MKKLIRTASLLLALISGGLARGAEFTVDPSGHHLLLNGKSFFWLGDTVWLLAQIPSRDELELYLTTRQQQGFTVIQLTAVMSEERVWGTTRANALGDKPFLNDNPLTPAVTPGQDPRDATQYDYWDHLDYVLERIHAHGLRAAVVAMFVGWGGDGYKFLRKDNACQYGRFLGERYRSKPQLIWVLGGDNTPDTPDKKEVWNLVAKGITEGVCGKDDYAQTLMTYHINGGASSSEVWHDAPWLDFNMAQTWSEYKDIYPRLVKDYRKAPAKPCGLGEGAYEDGPQYPTKPINDLVIRQQAYWSYFAGGYHTYGNGNVWHFDSVKAELTQPWKEALQSPGARNMGTLRKFFDSVGWSKFVPDPQLLAGSQGGGHNLNCAMRSASGDAFIFYLASTNAIRVSLPVDAAGFSATWVSPATGAEQSAGTLSGKELKVSLPAGWPDGLLRLSAATYRSPATAQIEFFVSPRGHDAWSGREREPGGTNGPFATLERARDAVRTLRQTPRPQVPVRVNIGGGTYYLDRAVEFAPEDSGAEGAPVIYAAAPGDKVVLSGGRHLIEGHWGEVNHQRTWVVEVPEAKQDGWRFRQLFVNGERRPRTRLPKQGEYRIEALPDVPITNEAWEKPVRRFVFAGKDIQRWHNLPDVEVMAPVRWVDNHLPIQAVDPDKRLVTFDRSSVFNLVELYHTKPSTYWVENVLEALDTPGQWYLDRALGQLFCLPAKDEDLAKAELVAPWLTQLVRIVGRPDAPVRFLRFEGLTFAHSEWQPPKDWAASGQAAVDVPGALFLTHASQCAIRHCQIEHVGTYAIEVGAGCKDIEISHNRLMDLGGGGVKVGHESQRITVADNEIAHGGRMFMSAVGVWVGHSAGNQIIHNHIHHFHYTGISVGWQWDFKPSKAGSNAVEFNHIHDLGHGLLSDMGGIYTLGVSPGTRLRDNVIHDIRARAYGGWGIYPDEGSSEILIENNLAYRCSSSPFFAHYNRKITVQNNIFALGEQCQVERAGAMAGPEQEYAFRRNIVYHRQGQLVGYWDTNNHSFTYERNLYWNASGAPLTFYGKSLAEWRAAGQDKDSLIADPLFVDPDHGNFTLRPESPAARIGFKPWDMSAAGPRASSAPKAFPTAEGFGANAIGGRGG